MMADRISKMFDFQATSHRRNLTTIALFLLILLCAQGCKQDQPSTPIDAGRALHNSKGCYACHSIDGVPKVGPSFLRLFGKTEQFEGGGSGVADEAYLRESILNPRAKIVKGFQPVMPAFEGAMSNEEIEALVAYIKSLK